MTAYALAHLRAVEVNDDIVEYLRRIDATLEPYDGAFLVHGVQPEVLEGDVPGVFVVIAFPDLDRARAWYDSPGYREILPLRTRNSDSIAVLLERVPAGYRAASLVPALAR